MKILSTSPTRIGLFGGGTDVPTYALKYGGLALSLSINFYQKTTLFTNPDLISFNKGQGGKNIIPSHADPQFYYRILEEFGLGDMHRAKLEAYFDGIIGSGLGSSASAAVSLIGAISKAKNLGLSKSEIAEKAWEIETYKFGNYGGKQDQYAAVYGGVNWFQFNNRVIVTQLSEKFISPIKDSFVLFYLGPRKKKNIQNGFLELTLKQVESLHKIKALALEAVKYLEIADLEGVGKVLDQSFGLKRLSNKGVITPEIDEFYKKGKKLGALGGKILGAGWGEFFLFMVYPEKKQRFIREMGLDSWDFNISWDGLQTRILND